MTIIPPQSEMGPDGGPIEILDLTPKVTLGLHSLNPDEAHLEENFSRCIECLRDLPDGGSCPADPDHVVEPLHAVKVGLGYDNDSDFYNWGTEQFEYPAVARG